MKRLLVNLVLLVSCLVLLSSGSESRRLSRRGQHKVVPRESVKENLKKLQIQNKQRKVNEVYMPEQIHLSYGAKSNQMMVTWVTLGTAINESYVEYGTRSLDHVVRGYNFIFKDGGSENRTMTIHRVLLDNLANDQQYRYHCGSSNFGWSSVYYFTTQPAGTNWAPRFAVFGDMGNVNAQSLTRLQEETVQGYYDAILHVGDFAYDMDTDNARVGDAFMNQIQSIAAYLPYMTAVGNHEKAYNFSNYVNRFSMPNKDGKTFGGDSNIFYSINIGPIHLISFSTEIYYYLEYGFEQVINQYNWLVEDLKTANLPENRAQQPWIITMAHRPMYCNDDDPDDCNNHNDIVRVGYPVIHKFGLEELFFKNGVDVEFWAHEHSYERFWPLYDYKMYNGSDKYPYTNPGAPVHIITGSAGCQERHDKWRPQSNLTAYRSHDYGYTRMQAFNASHLYMEQVSDDLGGKVIDSFWLIKDKHSYF